MAMTLTGAGAYRSSGGGSVTPTYRTGEIGSIGFGASFDFPTTITTYAGLKHIILLSLYTTDGTPTLALGGDAMTLKDSVHTGNDNWLLAFEVVPSSSGAGKTLTVSSSGSYVFGRGCFDMWTTASSATFSTSVSYAFSFIADPQQPSSDLTVPAGGFGLIQMYAGAGPVSANTGCTEVSERSDGSGYVWGAEMTATGRPSANIGSAAGSEMLAVSYG